MVLTAYCLVSRAREGGNEKTIGYSVQRSGGMKFSSILKWQKKNPMDFDDVVTLNSGKYHLRGEMVLHDFEKVDDRSLK